MTDRSALDYQAYMELVCYQCDTWPICEASNIEDCMRQDQESDEHLAATERGNEQCQ